MQKFRSKPVVIEAVQITDDWFDGEHPNALHPAGVFINPTHRLVTMQTIHGEAAVGRVGDWVIPESVPGRYYPCKPDVFERKYEPVAATSNLDLAT